MIVTARHQILNDGLELAVAHVSSGDRERHGMNIAERDTGNAAAI